MKRPYQDIWREGRLVEAGRRECAARYEAIRAVLEHELGHGFSVADVGGWDGYFAVRLAEDLDARAENIDMRDIALPCHRRLMVTGASVGEVGRHDAILCLSTLHHMEDWRAVYEGLKALCLLLIVEVCHPDETEGDLSKVMARTAHRVRPQYEHIAPEGDLIFQSPCLDNPENLRPMFLVRSGTVGRVEDGTGKAAAAMAKTTPADWEELGYEPYPGTLNIAVPTHAREWLEGLPGVKAPGLGRSRHYVPVTVNGLPAHVHFARSRPGRAVRTVELVAPVCLRETLGVDNGDQVEVRRV
jgi:hypothetical protein